MDDDGEIGKVTISEKTIRKRGGGGGEERETKELSKKVFLQFVFKRCKLFELLISGLREFKNKRTLAMKGEKPYVGSALRNMERTGISGIITVNLMP